MIKSKLKEVGKKFLESSFNLLDGSGIGKIPGVFRVFSYLTSICGGEIIVRMDGQTKMLAKNIPKNVSKKCLLYYGNDYEPHVTSLFCSMLEKGMTVVDVGASVGYYTLLAAKRVGDGGLVLSFEPEPFRFEMLIKNIKINGWNNVKAYQLAVSSSDKEMKLKPSGSGLSGGGFTLSAGNEDAVTVKSVTLDSFFLQTDPDIVKIDVEGGELEVLRGMRKILANGKAKIICELHPALLSSLGYSAKDIEDLLKQYNYNIYLIGGRGLIPTTSLADGHAHYLFTKEEVMDYAR